ncbi:hypothetical protein HMPREF9554_02032 [Treponema phagedenis F0421]|nr:hypothetical protein HMPREF9554_02032 [Treponema phagedenis F0421]
MLISAAETVPDVRKSSNRNARHGMKKLTQRRKRLMFFGDY